MATTSPLRQRMIEDMTIRNLSQATQRSYIYAVRKFSRHFGKSPARLGVEDVRAYQLHLIAHKRSWSHINQTACALRFFYGVTMGQQEAFERIVNGREPEKLPPVLTPEEIARFLEAVAGLRNRVALTTAYAAGLRIGEVCRLKPASIESKRMLIHVEGGKGAKDRYAMLSPRLLDILRTYWLRAHPGLWLFPGREPGDHVCHDFWWDRGDDRYTIDDVVARGRDAAARHGIHLLMDDGLVLDGVRFVGGTLWTDLRLGSWSLGHALNSSRRGMSDYKRIRRRRSGHHKYVSPRDTLALHRTTAAFLHTRLTAPSPLPTVVVTHHAPHPQSLPDASMDLRWCYASDLGALLDRGQPDLWIHGHTHNRADYRLGTTRIVCNPRGHIEEDSARTFDPALVIQVRP